MMNPHTQTMPEHSIRFISMNKYFTFFCWKKENFAKYHLYRCSDLVCMQQQQRSDIILEKKIDGEYTVG